MDAIANAKGKPAFVAMGLEKNRKPVMTEAVTAILLACMENKLAQYVVLIVKRNDN